MVRHLRHNVVQMDLIANFATLDLNRETVSDQIFIVLGVAESAFFVLSYVEDQRTNE